MKLLAVDTASKSASVALHDGKKLLGELFTDCGLTHSVTLMPAIESLLSACNTAVSEIDLFAVATGPGSFTGLRIGIASVKGLAFTGSTPCVAVSTLEGLAYNLRGMQGIACAVMDARRGQLYNALFSLGDSPVRFTPDRIVMLDELAAELAAKEEPIHLVGDGAALFYERFGKGLARVSMAPQERCMGRGSGIALAALAQYEKTGSVSPDALVPLYLRLPQAQRERMESAKHREEG